MRIINCGNEKSMKRSSSRVGFNVPPNTLYVISGTIFSSQMTQPTNSVKKVKVKVCHLYSTSSEMLHF